MSAVHFLDANGDYQTVSSDNPLPTSATGGSSLAFLSGTTNPDTSTGKTGDVYLNTTSGDLFKNTDGTWGLLMNIEGDPGTDANQAAAIPDSVATDVATLVSDYNSLLASLRTAGIIAQ